MNLPPPVADFFAAQEASDFNRLAQCFQADANVQDENQTIRGAAAIMSWMAEAKQKYQHRTEVLGVQERNGKSVVSTRVSGSFPNSPVVLEQAFTLLHGKIAALEIH